MSRSNSNSVSRKTKSASNKSDISEMSDNESEQYDEQSDNELCNEMQQLSVNDCMKLVEKTMNEFKEELESKFSKLFKKIYEQKYNETLELVKSGNINFEKEDKKQVKKSKKENKDVDKCVYMVKNRKTGEEKQCSCKALEENYCKRHKKVMDNQKEKEDKVKKEKVNKKKTENDSESEVEKKTEFNFKKENPIDIYDEETDFWSIKTLKFKSRNEQYGLNQKTNLVFYEDVLNCIQNKKPVYLIGRLVDNAIMYLESIPSDVKKWCNKCNIITEKINIDLDEDESELDE